MDVKTAPNSLTLELSLARHPGAKAPLDPQTGKANFARFLPALAVVLVIVAIFWKTIFCGQIISKVDSVAKTDSLFNKSMTSVDKAVSFDPSLYLYHIPVQRLSENIWRSGAVPLWNPFNGCGTPLIGDIQYDLFSPLRQIFRAS